MIIRYENLPIEIQATVGNGYISYSRWEDDIRRQIDQNIINFDKCWFFFDSEFLRAVKNASIRMSINMDWFRKYMKEEKLKVFTVSYDGIVEEKSYKDFSFLSEISQTCPTASETDEMVLEKNKMKIFANTIKYYGFTQEEIDSIEDDYEKYCEINKINGEDRKNSMTQFLKKQNDERTKLYGDILIAMRNLININRVFSGDIITIGHSGLSYGEYIEIFESEGIGSKRNRMRFNDYAISSQYFPAYLRNKDKWDEFKGKWLTTGQFECIIKGNINYNWYKRYEDTNDNQNQNNNKEMDNNKEANHNLIDNDKGVNIEIDNKDQIININMKSKQTTIDDVFGT